MVQPKLTVLITTYNRLNLLKRAIASVQQQKRVEFDILIVDDGSQDGTQDYLRSIKNHKISIHLKDKNKGLAHSRNIGVSKSKSKLIAFMDDDDIWTDQLKLYKQISAFKPKHLVSTAIQSDGKVVTEKLPSNWHRRLVYRNGFLHTSTMLIERKGILEIGGFDRLLTKGIDSDLYRRLILLNNYGLIHCSDVTVNYDSVSVGRITNQSSYLKRLRQYFERIYQLIKYYPLAMRYPKEYLLRVYISLSRI